MNFPEINDFHFNPRSLKNGVGKYCNPLKALMRLLILNSDADQDPYYKSWNRIRMDIYSTPDPGHKW